MKKTIFTLLLSLLLQVSFSQGTTLTKGETIDYLQKKLNEAGNFVLLEVDDENLKQSSCTFKNSNIVLSGNVVEIFLRMDFSGSAYNDFLTFNFNPATIKTIDPSAIKATYRNREVTKDPKSSISWLKLEFASSIGHKWGTTNILSNYCLFPYYNGDPQNGVRIKNAFLHLKDLIKAEGDPFDK